MLGSNKKKINPLLIVPLTALIIGPGLHDVNGLPKLMSLAVGTLILILMYPKYLKISSKIVYLPWAMVLSYGIIQLFQLNDLNSFLLGSYMRNGGYVSLICLALIITVISNLPINEVYYFKSILLITVCGLILYAILDFFDLLPYETVLNYQGALTLTLTNSNFASAYLGIAASGLLTQIIFSRQRSFSYILILTVILFLLFETHSLQGFLVLFVTCFICILYDRDRIIPRIIKFKKISFVIFLTSCLIFIINLPSFSSWFIANGSVKQRLSYWNLSLNIWQDNFITGVGLDNLRNFTTRYRTIELVKQEGLFVSPDRSHNVILDHFVNGGVFSGLFWSSFIVIISILALKNLIFKKNDLNSHNFIFVSVCWFGYLVQSLISVDHISLTVIGFISGGFIIAHNRENNGLQNSNFNLITKTKTITLGATIFLFFLFSFFAVKILEYEYNAYQYLINNDSNALQNVYSSKYVVAQTLEDVAVKVSQAKDFNNAYLLANKLLKHDPTSHQAYYMRAVYYESQNNLSQAKIEMKKALEIDQYNSVYLVGMAVLDFNLGDFRSSRDYLNKAISINPNQQGIDIVKNLLKEE